MIAVADMMREARLLASRVHPAGARWHRFLGSLSLDPWALSRPLPEAGPRDFIICGPPRSGTTLLAAALFRPPRVVTVVEPWAGMREPPAVLFRGLRTRIERDGVVSDGRLDVEALRRDRTVERVPEGAAPREIDLDPDWLLGVKWPTYWQYLGLLRNTRFLVCLRDPADVVASFKVEGGRLGVGLDFPTAFNRRLNRALQEATRDPAARRALLYEHITRAILPHLDRDNVLGIRYERWWDDREGLLRDLEAFLDTPIGPLQVDLHRSDKRRALAERDLDLIDELCPSARGLGYGAAAAAGR